MHNLLRGIGKQSCGNRLQFTFVAQPSLVIVYSLFIHRLFRVEEDDTEIHAVKTNVYFSRYNFAA